METQDDVKNGAAQGNLPLFFFLLHDWRPCCRLSKEYWRNYNVESEMGGINQKVTEGQLKKNS